MPLIKADSFDKSGQLLAGLVQWFSGMGDRPKPSSSVLFRPRNLLVVVMIYVNPVLQPLRMHIPPVA